MSDMNKIVLIGRLTRDLDSDSFGYTASGTAKAIISIAVNDRIKKNGEWQDEVSFFDVTVWGKMAENLKPYLLKGKQIAVEGKLKQYRYEKDGKNHSKISVVAEKIQLIGRSNGNMKNNAPYQQNYGNNGGYGYNQQTNNRNYNQPPQQHRNNSQQQYSTGYQYEMYH